MTSRDIMIGQRRIDPDFYPARTERVEITSCREEDGELWWTVIADDGFKYTSVTTDEIISYWPIIDETWEVEQLLKEYDTR
jgi:hypothetical protein